jgi:hypothetical protein
MRSLVEVDFEFWENGAGLGNAFTVRLALIGVRPLSKFTVIVSLGPSHYTSTTRQIAPEFKLDLFSLLDLVDSSSCSLSLAS